MDYGFSPAIVYGMLGFIILLLIGIIKTLDRSNLYLESINAYVRYLEK